MSLGKEEILDSIAAMSVMDLVELVSAIEEKFGVSAAAAVAPVSVAAEDESAAAVEQTEFSVTLTSAGDKKIAVIKEVRQITGLGLKESKDLVEGAPKLLKEAVSKEEAEAIVQKVVDAGGACEIK